MILALRRPTASIAYTRYLPSQMNHDVMVCAIAVLVAVVMAVRKEGSLTRASPEQAPKSGNPVTSDYVRGLRERRSAISAIQLYDAVGLVETDETATN
jgi:hypothetical protein